MSGQEVSQTEARAHADKRKGARKAGQASTKSHIDDSKRQSERQGYNAASPCSPSAASTAPASPQSQDNGQGAVDGSNSSSGNGSGSGRLRLPIFQDLKPAQGLETSPGGGASHQEFSPMGDLCGYGPGKSYTPSRRGFRNSPSFSTRPQSASRGSPSRGGMSPNNAKGARRGGRGDSQQHLGNRTGGLGSSSGLLAISTRGGEALVFSETNLDWSKLNIFRTRLCDRLTQSNSCHMANRCLFSHELSWPRRTPFLPRASALTLRYVAVRCPRLSWPELQGMCDSSGKVVWTVGSWGAVWNSPPLDQSACPRGDNCPFSHSLEELLYHPDVYKTTRCCLASDSPAFETDAQLYDGPYEMDSRATDNHHGGPNGSGGQPHHHHQGQQHGLTVALCPWYFCPFAHDEYELRDISSRSTWHLPPQMIDNKYVARTQGFDRMELAIIQWIRRAPDSTKALYCHSDSPLLAPRPNAPPLLLLPPVLTPAPYSALEVMQVSNAHRYAVTDNLTFVLVLSSLLNLLLYPVENFYTPTLLSLQGALLIYQLRLPPSPNITARALVNAFKAHVAQCAPAMENRSAAEVDGNVQVNRMTTGLMGAMGNESPHIGNQEWGGSPSMAGSPSMPGSATMPGSILNGVLGRYQSYPHSHHLVPHQGAHQGTPRATGFVEESGGSSERNVRLGSEATSPRSSGEGNGSGSRASGGGVDARDASVDELQDILNILESEEGILTVINLLEVNNACGEA